jgi:hypothetical protein
MAFIDPALHAGLALNLSANAEFRRQPLGPCVNLPTQRINEAGDSDCPPSKLGAGRIAACLGTGGE